MQKCQVHADAITWCLGGWSVLNQAFVLDFRDHFRDAHRGKREFYGVFCMFYDVLGISATPMKCSCPFRSLKLMFWFLRKFRWSCLMKNWRAKSLDCVRCWYSYSPCARAKGRYHTPPPHPTPPRKHVMWANGLSYKWAIFRAASETFANWLLPDWHCCFGSQPGILWSVHAKVESSGAEPSISSPALKWRWAGWTDENQTKWRTRCISAGYTQKLNDGSTRDVKNRGFCARYWRNWFGASTRGSFPQTGSVLLSTPSQDIIMFMSPKWHGTTGICPSMAAHQGEFHQQRLGQGLKPGFNSLISACALWLCKTECASKNFLPTPNTNTNTMSTNFAVVTSRYLPLPFFFGQLILTRSRNTEMMWLGQWLIQTYFNRHISGLLGSSLISVREALEHRFWALPMGYGDEPSRLRLSVPPIHGN